MCPFAKGRVMRRKPTYVARVAAEIQQLEQAIVDAREELRELKRKESLESPRRRLRVARTVR
jgi:hypothetical protein